MESRHFYLVILDVEGTVSKFNRNFETINSNPTESQFCDFLLPESALEFDRSLELILGSPRARKHLFLDHCGASESVTRVWWEFSVVTTPDMDLSGIIGIGVDVQFLEQEMPWNSLVDVLGFGKIVLDGHFHVQSWDDKISEWFDPRGDCRTEKDLRETPAFGDLIQLSSIFRHISKENQPKCFPVNINGSNQRTFAALLTVSNEGYDLFLVPNGTPTVEFSKTCFLPVEVLSALPGAVFVLDKEGKLSQQNEAAKNLGRIWKGRAYSEGHALTFPNQSNRFSKLLRAIEDGKRGDSTNLELRLLMPSREFEFWSASVRPISAREDGAEGILIQVMDLTELKLPLLQTNRENERLRELALSPSHILRRPLSSIIGLLELIDAKQLDKENQKLFSLLKPLTKELDQIIRKHAKKMSTFG